MTALALATWGATAEGGGRAGKTKRGLAGCGSSRSGSVLLFCHGPHENISPSNKGSRLGRARRRMIRSRSKSRSKTTAKVDRQTAR